jgi:hypothetical protein
MDTYQLSYIFKLAATNFVKSAQETVESAGDTIVSFFNDHMSGSKGSVYNEIMKKINEGVLGDAEVSSVSVNPFINDKKVFGVIVLINGVQNGTLSKVAFDILSKQGIQNQINAGKIIFSKIPDQNMYSGWVKAGK